MVCVTHCVIKDSQRYGFSGYNNRELIFSLETCYDLIIMWIASFFFSNSRKLF